MTRNMSLVCPRNQGRYKRSRWFCGRAKLRLVQLDPCDQRTQKEDAGQGDRPYGIDLAAPAAAVAATGLRGVH